MLDHVERRSLLVQPAREHPPVAVLRIVRLLDVELHEGAGQLLRLPRGGRLARPQADDRIPHPRRLSGLQREVLGEAVALVEEAEDGDPLPHGRGPGDFRTNRLRHVDGARPATPGGGPLPIALPAAGEQGEGREGDEGRPQRRAHPWSGVHAS
jgi:hypothetical protein